MLAIALRHAAQVRDDLAGDLDGVDAFGRERRMRLEAADAAACTSACPCARRRAPCRSVRRRCSRPVRSRRWRGRRSAGGTPMQPTSSSYDSAKCSGRASLRADHLRHQRERDGDEALHVADAASDQAVADLDGLPRIGRAMPGRPPERRRCDRKARCRRRSAGPIGGEEVRLLSVCRRTSAARRSRDPRR